MKEIKAYIRNKRVDAVVDALKHLPEVPGVAVAPVSGFGHAHDGDGLASVEMTKLEVDVADASVEPVIECIVRHARTGHGHAGDGKIHVTPLDDAVGIVDGARGAAVLARAAAQPRVGLSARGEAYPYFQRDADQRQRAGGSRATARRMKCMGR